MRTYAMTGGATGIGAELKGQLLAEGHKVISVDIKEGDIIADLSTAEGRKSAIDGVRELAPDGLDGGDDALVIIREPGIVTLQDAGLDTECIQMSDGLRDQFKAVNHKQTAAALLHIKPDNFGGGSGLAVDGL